MQIKQCDICKKQVERIKVLVPEYTSDSVSEVCESCLKEINDLLTATMKAQQIQRTNFVRRFINNMVAK